MAGLGPRELDVAWMVYSHRAFEDIAARYGFPGMPGFLPSVVVGLDLLGEVVPRRVAHRGEY